MRKVIVGRVINGGPPIAVATYLFQAEVTDHIWLGFPAEQVQICRIFWLVLSPFVRSRQKLALVSLMVPEEVTGVQVC